MKIIEKPWQGTEHQVPAPKIEVFLPSNKSPILPNHTFLPDMDAGAWSKLKSYNFTESVDDLEGSFSFVTECGEEELGDKNIFDLISIRSVIKIYEGGKQPVFVGIIRRRKISKQMTSQGMNRTVTFSGKSITSLIAEFMVSLDPRIGLASETISKSNELIDNFTKLKNEKGKITIADFISITWDHFYDFSNSLSKKINKGITNTKVAEIIELFLGNNFVHVDGANQDIMYDLASVFYNESNNSIVNIWQNILPKNCYEMFSRYEKADSERGIKEGTKIIIRQVPFGDPENKYKDWVGLDLYVISPISLIGYDLEQNDETVYTAFMSYIIGSVKSREFYRAIMAAEDNLVKFDAAKMEIYGFKPFEIDFMGYDRSGNTENKNEDKLKEAIKNVNELAAYWYSRLDDMYSGTLTICTDFNNPEKNPRAGCRAKFLGGEFYINKADHSWVYGGTPTIKLSVSRGMVYYEGKMSGVIPNVGSKFRELEQDALPPGRNLPIIRR